jgi:opacity protein-like surface antigen
MKKWIVLLCAVVLSVNTYADDAVVEKDITTTKKEEAASGAAAIYHENKVELSLQTGAQFDIVHELNYATLPQAISIGWQLDELNENLGIFSGNTEMQFSGVYSQIVDGPENHWAGFLVGPRYNFVQGDGKWSPYVEAKVGLGFIDAQPVPHGQGQDFTFSFTTAAGIRYNFNPEWSMDFALNYQHISNGGLSEPRRKNQGLDIVGPRVALTYGF